MTTGPDATAVEPAVGGRVTGWIGMRTGIPILAATLALTVFLTSLVLEQKQDNSSVAKVTGAPAFPASARILLGRGQADGKTLIAGPATGASTSRTADLLKEARRFCAAGNLKGATELLRAVLRVEPENREALEDLGVIAFALKQYETAETSLRHLIEIDPFADTMMRARLGVAQMRLRKYGLALNNLKLVLRDQPEDGALHFALACVYARLMERKRALYHLAQARRLMGPSLLEHIGDPHLDPIRATRQFQMIVTLAQSQQVAAKRTVAAVSSTE